MIMTETPTLLLVTIGTEERVYEESLEAIRKLKDGESIDSPATLTFANEKQLGDVFNERTYTLLRTIRQDEPESIRETAGWSAVTSRTSIRNSLASKRWA